MDATARLLLGCRARVDSAYAWATKGVSARGCWSQWPHACFPGLANLTMTTYGCQAPGAASTRDPSQVIRGAQQACCQRRGPKGALAGSGPPPSISGGSLGRASKVEPPDTARHLSRSCVVPPELSPRESQRKGDSRRRRPPLRKPSPGTVSLAWCCCIGSTAVLAAVLR